MVGRALVIGYGNTLRGDDGAGPKLAEQLTDLSAIACAQVTPELALDVRACEIVIFVDASAALAPGAVVARRLSAEAPTPALTHHCSPEALLYLAEALYGARPVAYLVTIGAASFALGDDLSPTVAAALREAAALVRRLAAT